MQRFEVSNTKVLIPGINSNAKIIFWTVIGGKNLFLFYSLSLVTQKVSKILVNM
jgi:hypothetical protein